MYETEANDRVETLEQIPAAVQDRFRELNGTIQARTLLPWGEHCTECVWPSCYTTCDLYSPREDLRCRRFEDGMVRIDCPGSANSYILKIRFKRWGKLWSPGNVHLYSPDQASRREQWDHRIGSGIRHLPLFDSAKRLVTNKRFAIKNTLAQRRPPSEELPTAFIVECYNPSDVSISLSLTMRALDQAAKVPFQTLIEVRPGFQRARIPLDDITAAFVRSPFHVELIPNEVADGTTLYFGLVDFVRESQPPAPAKKQPRVKCVVWDLDNTLWDGVLVEDGTEYITLKPGILDILRELDRRGILQSVASKNDFEYAKPVLERLGLLEFFLYPQISWGPKSVAIDTIAKSLNIGRDTLLFVDDSEFERAEVGSACPDVRILDAAKCSELFERSDCIAEITAEGSTRRKLYQQDMVRQQASASFGDDYLAFLKDCELELTIKPLSAENLTRAHELTQRTNQMNFSGTRYDREVLERLLGTPEIDAYVLECRDRFGSYGVIGFSVVDSREPRMTDLMFSCRVQSKRVEHAFLRYLFQRYIGASNRDFWANYRKTPRNAPSGRVFDDVGMEETTTSDGVTSLVFRAVKVLEDDGIVKINAHVV